MHLLYVPVQNFVLVEAVIHQLSLSHQKMSMHLAWPTCVLFYSLQRKMYLAKSFIFFSNLLPYTISAPCATGGTSIHMTGKLVLMMVGGHLSGVTEEIHRNPQLSYPVFGLRSEPRYDTVSGNSRGCHLSPSSPESRGPRCLRLWPGLPQDKVEPVMREHENQAAPVPSSQMGEPLYSAKCLWLNNKLYVSVFVMTKVVWNCVQYP
jgi:hypothetical protein